MGSVTSLLGVASEAALLAGQASKDVKCFICKLGMSKQ